MAQIMATSPDVKPNENKFYLLPKRKLEDCMVWNVTALLLRLIILVPSILGFPSLRLPNFLIVLRFRNRIPTPSRSCRVASPDTRPHSCRFSSLWNALRHFVSQNHVRVLVRSCRDAYHGSGAEKTDERKTERPVERKRLRWAKSKVNWKETETAVPSRVAVMSLHLEKFLRIKELFALYAKVAGFQLLVSLCESGLLELSLTWKAIRYTDHADRVGGWDAGVIALQQYLCILLILYVGQSMKEAIQEARRYLILVLARRKRRWAGVVRSPEENAQEKSLTVITKHILGWRWNLRTCDVLEVGNCLLRMIIGNSVNMVLFMLSLKLTELK